MIDISLDLASEIETLMRQVTDQTIIASSQQISGASVRPRLRIMSEVHRDGNPHTYSEIRNKTINLIVSEEIWSDAWHRCIEKELPATCGMKINIGHILHNRNGKHHFISFPL